MEKLKKLNWLVIDETLSTTVKAIDEIDEVEGEIDWIYDLLMSVEKPTYNDIEKYYSKTMDDYLTVFYMSIIEEQYEVSSKIKKIMKFQSDETIKQSEKLLTMEEQLKIKELVNNYDKERLHNLEVIINERDKNVRK